MFDFKTLDEIVKEDANLVCKVNGGKIYESTSPILCEYNSYYGSHTVKRVFSGICHIWLYKHKIEIREENTYRSLRFDFDEDALVKFKIIKAEHKEGDVLKIKDNGRHIIIYKTENDYIEYDRKTNETYRILNGTKRKNKDMKRFAKGYRIEDIDLTDAPDYIKLIIRGINDKERRIKQAGTIIEKMFSPKWIHIEQWLKFDEFPIENVNILSIKKQQEIVGECELGSYYDSHPIIKPNWYNFPEEKPSVLNKKIKTFLKTLTNENGIVPIKYVKAFTNPQTRYRDIDLSGVNIDILMNNILYIKEQVFKPENYELREHGGSWRTHALTQLESIIELSKICVKYNCDIEHVINYLLMMSHIEGLEPDVCIDNWKDYLKMKTGINKYIDRNKKIKKYPKNLLTQHHIASKLYKQIREQHNEDMFKDAVNEYKHLEYEDKEWIVITPKRIADVHDEANQMNNCLSSYVNDIINKTSKILFVRKAENPYESVISLEVVGDVIKQVYRESNNQITAEDKEFIEKWAKEKDLIIY